MKKFLLNSSCVPQLEVPNDRGLINAFKAYQTSLESELLNGETKRKLYPEILRFKDHLQEQIEDFSEKLEFEKEPEIIVEDSGSDSEAEQEVLKKLAEEKTQWFLNIPEEAFSNYPLKLSELCLETFAKNFKKGQISPLIQGSDFVKIGELLDIDLPLLDTLEIDNETYWKSVVDVKSHNRYDYEKLSRTTSKNWKRIGIELKFLEYIENLPAEEFEAKECQEILNNQKLHSIIQNLSIRQLQPVKYQDNTPEYPEYKIRYIFDSECHHGSLQFIEKFKKLKNISLVFGKNDIGKHYDRRFFEVSDVDIKLLSRGLKHLNQLQTFTIQNSKLNDKIKILRLLKSLRKLKLKKLEISHCYLQDDIGQYFMKFFEVNKSLEELELSGNCLGAKVCNDIGVGLSKFKGTLKYLGLSRNPITEDGFLAIGAGVKDTSNVQYLDISLCDVGKMGCKRIVQFIDIHKQLKKINFSNIHFTEHYGNRLINMLIGNLRIEDIEARCCNLSHDQMLNIKILLARNKYYRENPILLKQAPWTEEDELKANIWMKADKHPLIIKHKKIYEEGLKILNESVERDKVSIVNDRNLNESFLQNKFKIA